MLGSEIKLNGKSAFLGKAIHITPYSIDKVGVEERAHSFSTRSVKAESKMWALYTAISMIDLTTLEGMDTKSRVRQLCQKAKFPLPQMIHRQLEKFEKYFGPIPQVAAVCVYPNMVETAVNELKNTSIQVASVATGFPSGQVSLKVKLMDVKQAVESGATEIDMVIDRGSFLSGDFQKVFDEIVSIKSACGDAHLKVILETGELGSYQNVAVASQLALEAGADFIKTSTGKISPAATLPVTLIMLNAILDYYDKTNRKVGMKPAGGIRNSKQAIQYLCMVSEVMGNEWMTPNLFRFGASALLNDLLRQVFKQTTGNYFDSKLFSID